MSTYDLEEQEQLAALKAWWRQYSGMIVAIVFILMLVLGAWSGWNWYQRSQAAQASSIYEQLQKAARASDIKAVRDTSGMILEQFPRSTYAPLAALVSAKIHFQTGDLKTAKAQLKWVVDHALAKEIKSVARLRLAVVLIDGGETDEASKVLEGEPTEGFAALYFALKGDVLLAQSKLSEARIAYKKALEPSAKLESAMRELLQLKLDALGESS